MNRASFSTRIPSIWIVAIAVALTGVRASAQTGVNPGESGMPEPERIYDVACADRAVTSAGRCDGELQSTVDEANATYLNTIGDADLRAVWTDPDFNSKHSAVYYTRVLEIPTPTWQAFDAQFYGVKMPDQVPLSHQERAYTSPSWYSPAN